MHKSASHNQLATLTARVPQTAWPPLSPWFYSDVIWYDVVHLVKKKNSAFWSLYNADQQAAVFAKTTTSGHCRHARVSCSHVLPSWPYHVHLVSMFSLDPWLWSNKHIISLVFASLPAWRPWLHQVPHLQVQVGGVQFNIKFKKERWRIGSAVSSKLLEIAEALLGRGS